MLKSNQGTIDKKVLYAQAVYGEEEKLAVMYSLENGWLASGPKVKEFEEKVAALFGKKYGVAVNSGSSANLVAISALGLPKGGKVITPALTFATTVSEIVLNGLIPVFIDGVIGRYTIDEEQVEAAIDEDTVAIMVPQLIGGVCNMQKLRELADRYNLYLIDDSCDTLAPSLNGKTLAQYADVTTTSFYGSHIITACGIGGMALTDDAELRDKMITIRDWGRVGNDREEFSKRFDFEIDGIPYDAKFLYSNLGYNLKMNEASAAFGIEQLKKLPEFLKKREYNFGRLFEFFVQYLEWFYLPDLMTGAETNWLAFPLTIRPEAPFKRYDFLKHLEERGIQTRVLFSGNITRHPIYREQVKYQVVGNLDSADYIMANGLLLGAHHGMDDAQIDYVINAAREFFDAVRTTV